MSASIRSDRIAASQRNDAMCMMDDMKTRKIGTNRGTCNQ